jgi:Tol biopolymer transport system component
VCQPDAEVGVSGALLLPSGGGLEEVSLPDRAARPLPVLPPGGVVNHVARSPDGSRLAVARFSRPAGDPVGGSDVVVTGPDGGAPLLTISRERPGELLGAPAWLPDGGLVFERQSIAGPADSRLERVDADGSSRRLVVERAASPAISPDGSLLTFVRSEATDRLLIRPLAGGAEQVLVDDPSFAALAFPRFSPDGRWLAFSAVGGPSAEEPVLERFGLDFLLPRARPARAHGVPWDIWLVRPEGGELRRLTSFYDDDPAAAWSPDGRWLAVFSGEALHVVSSEGPGGYCILGSGGYGGLEWMATS